MYFNFTNQSTKSVTTTVTSAKQLGVVFRPIDRSLGYPTAMRVDGLPLIHVYGDTVKVRMALHKASARYEARLTRGMSRGEALNCVALALFGIVTRQMRKLVCAFKVHSSISFIVRAIFIQSVSKF